MKLASLRYEKRAGWNHPLPTNMDSEQTMILSFAAPSYLKNPEVISDLANGKCDLHNQTMTLTTFSEA